jgi:hypothetical protein
MTLQSLISFEHGLGDCANFALQLPLYIKRGWDITIACDENKLAIFELVGAKTIRRAGNQAKLAKSHGWSDSNYVIPPADNLLQNNKARQNFLTAPMPAIADEPIDELWREYLLREAVNFSSFTEITEAALANLPRPLFLLHSNGNTNPASKNMPANFALELATQLMRKTTGSIIFLDWDNRVSWFHSGRSRHLTQHFAPEIMSPRGLMGLIAAADLLIGVDSGPFHLAGMVDAPSIGVWFSHHPAHFALPRKNCLNIVCKNSPINLPAAALLNTVTNEKADPHYVADAAVRMTKKPRWFSSAAEDTQMADLVDKCFGRGLNIAGLGDILGDRSKSFGIALDQLATLPYAPTIVETGCIRADNDWAGAGYSTFILGLAAERFGGTMCSIDIDAGNINYAAHACKNIKAARFVTADSLVGLAQIDKPIDLLYLDSMDTYVAGHDVHGLKEAQVGAPKVSQDGLILFDDTLNVDGKITGKGALAIPWLLDNGWRIVFSGYQVVLARK